MTPTEQDKELRIAIHERMIAFRREDGNGYVDRCIEHLDSVMQLITTDRKRVALEARISELQAKKRGFYMAAGLFGADISRVEELWEKCKQELESYE